MERAGFMTCTAANHQGAIKEPAASLFTRCETHPGGTIPVAQKKKKNIYIYILHVIPTSAPATARGWMQIIIIDEELCPWKDIRNPAPKKKKKKDENEARVSLSGRLHS